MIRKLVYKGDRKFLLISPVLKRIEKGTEIEVNNKEVADELIDKGFEEVKEPQKKTKKEGEA